MKRTGRSIGIALFAIGIAALIVVFALAAVAFARVPAQIEDPNLVAQRGVGGVLAAAAVKALFLLVMTYAASLLASKGIELSHAAGDEDEGGQ